MKIINEESLKGLLNRVQLLKKFIEQTNIFKLSLYKTSVIARLTNLSLTSFYINTSFDMLCLNLFFYKQLRYLDIIHYLQLCSFLYIIIRHWVYTLVSKYKTYVQQICIEQTRDLYVYSWVFIRLQEIKQLTLGQSSYKNSLFKINKY